MRVQEGREHESYGGKGIVMMALQEQNDSAKMQGGAEGFRLVDTYERLWLQSLVYKGVQGPTVPKR